MTDDEDNGDLVYLDRFDEKLDRVELRLDVGGLLRWMCQTGCRA
jgi:hypothetical protein